VYPGFIGRYPSGGGDVSDVPNNYKLLKVEQTSCTNKIFTNQKGLKEYMYHLH